MTLPPTVSEADFIAATAHVTKALGKFARYFGGEEDLGQEVVVWSLEAVKKYDPAAGSLGALLYKTARNRCLNRIRDTLQRSDAPCARCHAGTPCGEDGEPCKRYRRWAERNERKAKVTTALHMSVVKDVDSRVFESASTADNDVLARDLSALIDANLPVHLRSYYLQMRDGSGVVSYGRRKEVRRAVGDILKEAGVDVGFELDEQESGDEGPLK